jgi:hypothetical protein
MKHIRKLLLETFGLDESIYDKNILKAIIMVGGPGSGKGYIVNKISKIINPAPKVVNSDTVYEWKLKYNNLSLKMSVASFKTREGDPIGVAVTLRGARMFGFLDKVLNVSLPRTKDFRGLNRTSVDDIGNMTFGIKEHTIFPEIKDEELKDVFGMAVTMVTTAKTKEEATAFFELIGIPFKKA